MWCWKCRGHTRVLFEQSLHKPCRSEDIKLRCLYPSPEERCSVPSAYKRQVPGIACTTSQWRSMAKQLSQPSSQLPGWVHSLAWVQETQRNLAFARGLFHTRLCANTKEEPVFSTMSFCQCLGEEDSLSTITVQTQVFIRNQANINSICPYSNPHTAAPETWIHSADSSAATIHTLQSSCNVATCFH